MNREDIIRLRDECDEWAENHLQCKGEYHPDFHTVSDERFAALVAAAEREACAKVCEELRTPSYLSISEGSVWDTGTLMCADAIRARGQA